MKIVVPAAVSLALTASLADQVAVGDVLARQVAILLMLKNRNPEPSRSDRRTRWSPWDILGKNKPTGVGCRRSGYVLPPAAHPEPVSP